MNARHLRQPAQAIQPWAFLTCCGMTLVCAVPAVAQDKLLESDDHSSSNQIGIANLAESLTSEETDVALRAAWYRVQLAMQDKLANRRHSMSAISAPAEDVSRFLGFVEARLRVALPATWANCVSGVELWWNGNTHFPADFHSPWDEQPQSLEDLFRAPKSIPGFSVTEDDERVRINLGTGDYPTAGRDASFVLPDSLAEHLRAGKELLGHWPINPSAIVVDNLAFVIVLGSDDNLLEPRLYCLRTRKTQNMGDVSEIVWDKPVMDILSDEYKGAMPFTQIRVQGEVVLLFHCSSSSFGIEGSDFEGNQVFAFSSLEDK